MNRKTLVIGSGDCAVSIANKLQAGDIDFIVASHGDCKSSFGHLDNRAEIIEKPSILSCSGYPGNFEVALKSDGEKLVRNVANVIIAEEYQRISNHDLYNLSPANGVLSISELPVKEISQGDKAVFLTGTAREANAVLMEEIMTSALGLREKGVKVYILLNNLKVAGNGLEALYRKTREAGVMYVKFTDNAPDIAQDSHGRVTIEFNDEVTRQRFRLSPDLVVVDERFAPADSLKELGEIFRLHTDDEGFLQADNVHRYTVLTNRRGIIAAGPSRGVISPSDSEKDASCAVSLTLELLEGKLPDDEPKAEIDAGNCVRCLTCYRLCSYRAIRIKDDFRLEVMPEVCERCAMCAAECPRGAVSIQGLGLKDIAGKIGGANETGKKFKPSITVFSCARSGGRAKEAAGDMGLGLPENLSVVEVPCGGGISVEFLFEALNKRSDGALVLACHKGNCHSEQGATLAGKRMDNLLEKLSAAGVDKNRVLFKRLAGNMGSEFADIVNKFEKQLMELGPSKLN